MYYPDSLQGHGMTPEQYQYQQQLLMQYHQQQQQQQYQLPEHQLPPYTGPSFTPMYPGWGQGLGQEAQAHGAGAGVGAGGQVQMPQAVHTQQGSSYYVPVGSQTGQKGVRFGDVSVRRYD